MARAKNQYVFLTRCQSHKVFPKFLNIGQPFHTRRGKTITEKYKYDLLIAAKNDARDRFHLSKKYSSSIKTELQEILSNDHFTIVKNITESCREKALIIARNKLKNKFELLLKSNLKSTSTLSTVKECILNLVDDNIPINQAELLNLAQSFR